MANNGKGKSIYIGTEEEEFDKVLRTYYLNDLLLDAFGGEPIDEYGSYRKIPKELRTKILTHLRKQDGYYEALLSDDEEEEEEKQEPVDTVLPKFDELEQKISNLEKVFKYLKEKKDKEEKELKKKKKRGNAEGSGSNY
jgi:hypothetical protein